MTIQTIAVNCPRCSQELDASYDSEDTTLELPGMCWGCQRAFNERDEAGMKDQAMDALRTVTP